MNDEMNRDCDQNKDDRSKLLYLWNDQDYGIRKLDARRGENGSMRCNEIWGLHFYEEMIRGSFRD